MGKLWGGRFTQDMDTLAAKLNASIDVDWRLASYDIQGSIAWAQSLGRCAILSSEEVDLITEGLRKISIEVDTGVFPHHPGDEDVHSAIERRLVEIIGPVGSKLHTGRSRNDQVMTDFYLWVKTTLEILERQILGLQKALLARAKLDFQVLMPGYTHFQRAQPILLTHWWMSHFWPLQRDRQQIALTRLLCDELPLGSGALSGCPYPIDRLTLAEELGFHGATHNSIDAVANRDVAVTLVFNAALIALHLSRLAEALILFSTSEFGFLELSDAFTTGSSLMPQKKNPDLLELIRGKSGTILGKLTGLMTTLKGLPSAYDKDLQEDKTAVFDATDTILLLLEVMTPMISTLTIHPEKMIAAIDPGMFATEVADFLVFNGVPFREAHHIVGKLVTAAQSNHTHLHQLSPETLKDAHPLLVGDLSYLFDPYTAVSKRNAIGGTSPTAVQAQIEYAEQVLAGS